ncbi:MAG TPA: hypothetical protein VFV68_16705, partial [Agriterribacter sp.]|nr:hypothetical protein [Agriterribacter sp.]
SGASQGIHSVVVSDLSDPAFAPFDSHDPRTKEPAMKTPATNNATDILRTIAMNKPIPTAL